LQNIITRTSFPTRKAQLLDLTPKKVVYKTADYLVAEKAYGLLIWHEGGKGKYSADVATSVEKDVNHVKNLFSGDGDSLTICKGDEFKTEDDVTEKIKECLKLASKNKTRYKTLLLILIGHADDEEDDEEKVLTVINPELAI